MKIGKKKGKRIKKTDPRRLPVEKPIPVEIPKKEPARVPMESSSV
jgi:hypothetical protein